MRLRITKYLAITTTNSSAEKNPRPIPPKSIIIHCGMRSGTRWAEAGGALSMYAKMAVIKKIAAKNALIPRAVPRIARNTKSATSASEMTTEIMMSSREVRSCEATRGPLLGLTPTAPDSLLVFLSLRRR